MHRSDKKGRQQFWAHVRRSPSCWLWIGCLTAGGYGKVEWKKRTWQAHRVVWFLRRGKIPKGRCVLHHCDNRACVRLSHLFLGTRRDNYHDMQQKGRHVFGERHHRSVLTSRQVAEIRRRAADGERQCELAREFKVGEGSVSRIVHNIRRCFDGKVVDLDK